MLPLSLAIAALFAVQTPEIDLALAARAFQEARWLSEDDGGKLWGKTLYGPMVFVDPRTRRAVANEMPPIPSFEPKQGLYVGQFPEGQGIANYGFNWGGKRWTMVMWPLPQNRAERATLMAHELFHRIQPELGFPGSAPKNAHLEETEGRIWIQIELTALSKALNAETVEERGRHAADALRFRAVRQARFAGAKAEEDALEINEGLAQFTGFMLRGGWEPEARKWLANQLAQMGDKPSYTRTFGYWTGAAYAFLLNVGEAAKFDEIRWRKELGPNSSLATAYASLAGVSPSANQTEAMALAKAYGYDEVAAKEQTREAERRARHEAIRKRLFDGPALILDLEDMNLSFDNRTIVALGSLGTYYGAATLNNAWGKLEVTDGVVVSSDFKTARVQAPASADDRKGPGWTLVLKSGFRLIPGERKGDFQLARG